MNNSRINLFVAAKISSIEQVIKRFIQAIETRDVRPDHQINSLAINIMEAVLEDERMENFDNAETGKLLAKYVHTHGDTRQQNLVRPAPAV